MTTLKTKFTIVALGLSGLFSFAPAQDAPSGSTDFSASSVVFFEADNRVVLSEDAQLIGEDFQMNADEIVVFFAVDEEGNRSVDTLNATGAVAAVIEGAETTSETANYDANTQTAIFVGNVVSKRGGSVVRGERLEADINTGVYRVIGSVQGTISGSF